ncbi:NUDIX hydrolase [Ascidiaceihabitans sp.]|uniref:NUDIX hydrolase n=2 Tax=Ascidiaceihabitans sp. TaxID=1872644 RepID=UPI0032983026
MSRLLNAFWESILSPMFQRPKRLQVAALCHRERAGVREVLLVTSRDTGRWIIPKGWPMRGKNGAESALQEAWEEAGVTQSIVNPQPIGSYTYAKRKASGLSVPVRTLVYDLPVKTLSDDFPEALERTRKWVPAAQAAEMVNETALKAILRQF